MRSVVFIWCRVFQKQLKSHGIVGLEHCIFVSIRTYAVNFVPRSTYSSI